MKIGIITQPLHTNYGGLLQNFALQQVLKRMGYEAITLDQVYYPSNWYRQCLSIVKTFLLYIIKKETNRLYPWQKYQVQKNSLYFKNKYITCSPKLFTKNEVRDYIIKNELSAIVVGSDQVWRPKYNKDILNSFLDFLENSQIKRIAYAASFGIDYWEFTPEQTIKCQKLVKLFDAISVREDSGIDLCKNYLNCNATHVLDPTLLLDVKDYLNLINDENPPKNDGNLFTYILDRSNLKENIIKKVSTELNLNPFSLIPQNNIDIFPPVAQWLQAFIDAKFVISDSFHGTVFSIIFNKPFIVISNQDRGMTRLSSLLKLYKLEDRQINKMSDLNSIFESQIDWDRINQIHKILRKDSIDFILNCFNE